MTMQSPAVPAVPDPPRAPTLTMDAFDYELPSELIAQHPADPRDSARLLVDRGAGLSPVHQRVADLPALLSPGDLVVVNDTRVLPARLRLRRESGGEAEVLLLRPASSADLRHWEALVRPGRKLRPGEVLRAAHPCGDDLTVEIGERDVERGVRYVRLRCDGDPVTALNRHGAMPLPPYITAPLRDPERYQTVYANRAASAAAPTAGLHLTSGLIEALAARGVGFERLELVVGLDTFRPVSVDDPAAHVIHRESYAVEQRVLDACAATRAAGGKVVAVGTTTARALESAARGPLAGETDLFIRAPFDWQVVDRLVTNFHVPRTTLLLLVHAFVGDRWRDCYETAVRERYRFLSFGDCMLLRRD